RERGGKPTEPPVGKKKNKVVTVGRMLSLKETREKDVAPVAVETRKCRRWRLPWLPLLLFLSSATAGTADMLSIFTSQSSSFSVTQLWLCTCLRRPELRHA
ncbi:hypothetical protein PIB30_069887, partial [Stylosanthes scabra]|nr:hypothetical protein [Stylosanthes scabra]